jgi:hypothetical protein
MNRPSRLGPLALLALFAAFQLLAPAPLLHAHCGMFAGSAGARAAAGGPAFAASTDAPTSPLGDCPACSLSGLSAVFVARLAVSTPVLAAGPTLPAERASAAAPYLEFLRGRAPPAA